MSKWVFKSYGWLQGGETGYLRIHAPDKSGIRTRYEPNLLSQYPPCNISGLPDTRVRYPVPDIVGTHIQLETDASIYINLLY